MKRRLYLILLLAVVALSGMAQNVGDAFYIYRNDGQYDGFLRDEVISIDYSYEDAEGNLYDEIVTQVITTSDSIYKIPLAAIDSISFVQPKTIYQDDVTPLNGSLYQYIIGADGQKLKLKASTPPSLLPKIGDKLALLEMTDVLPTGFLGKVNSVATQSDAIVLDCDGIGLLEAAKQYYSVGYVDITSENSQFSRQLRTPRRSSIGRPIQLPFLGRYLNVGAEFFDKRNDLLLDAGVEAYYLIMPVLQVKGVAMIDDDIGGYVNMVALTDLNYNWSCKFSGGFSEEVKQSFLGEGVDIPIVPGLNFYFDVGIYGKLEGSLCWKAEGNGSYSLVVQAIGDLLHPENNSLTPRLKRNYSDEVNSVLVGNLTTQLGLYAEAGLSIGSAKLLKGGIDAAFGLQAEASVTAFKADWENATTSTHLYEQLTTPGNGEVSLGFFGKVGITGGFAAGFGGISGGLSVDFDLGPKIYIGFVPIFENVKASWIPPTTKAQASARIERNVFCPVQIGFTAIDDEGNREETIYDQQSFLSTLEKSHYVLTFNDLDVLKDYKVHPVVKLFNQEILASPSVELKYEQSVTTLDATDISENSACLNGQLGIYRPNMNGQVFFYYGTDNNPKDSGTFISAGDGSNLTNNNFKIILTRLQPGTTYYYVAGYSDGKESVYGEVLSFQTIDPNSVITLGATNVTKTEATLNGRYESTDISAEYGIIYGTSGNLTYTSGNRIAVSSSSNGEFSVYLSDLTKNTEYYYRAYLKANGKLYYGDISYFRTKADAVNPCPDGNHPHVIDLGLPSHTKWACCNVGASSPHDKGGCYAWGETHEKEEYTRANYTSPYYYGNFGGLQAKDDAAATSMGGKWITPSYVNILELIEKSSFVLINEQGQEVSFGDDSEYVKVIGPNGNSIVLPLGNYWSSQEIWGEGEWYWDTDGFLRKAFTMYVTSRYYYLHYVPEVEGHNHNYNDNLKWLGNSVRAVCR